MKFRISDSAAGSLSLLAIIVRIFGSVAVDMPDLHNAGWLAVLLGGALSLPLAWAAGQLRSHCSVSPFATLTGHCQPLLRVTAALFALTALLDAAAVARTIASSASYVALNSLPMFALLLPQLLVCLWCLTLNGDAIGFAAGIWNRILPLLLLIVILLQFSAFRPAWLTPLLGPGLPDLLDGALRVSGGLSMLAGLFLIAEQDPDGDRRRFQPIKTMLVCTLAAAVLLVLRSMMTPPLFKGKEASIFFQLDTLLSNGRAPLSLQLPMIILWFVSLLFLLLFDAFLFAAMLQRALPRIGRRLSIAIVLISIGGLALSGFISRESALHISVWLFAAQSALLASIMLFLLIHKKEVAHA